MSMRILRSICIGSVSCFTQCRVATDQPWMTSIIEEIVPDNAVSVDRAYLRPGRQGAGSMAEDIHYVAEPDFVGLDFDVDRASTSYPVNASAFRAGLMYTMRWQLRPLPFG